MGQRSHAIAESEALSARIQSLSAELPPHSVSTIDLGDLRRTSPISRDWGYETRASGRLALHRAVPVILRRRHPGGRSRGPRTGLHATFWRRPRDAERRRRFGRRQPARDDCQRPPAAQRTFRPRRYDCIILTQTLHVIDDMPAVVAECERITGPGGVLLAKSPSASRVRPRGTDRMATSGASLQRAPCALVDSASIVSGSTWQHTATSSSKHGIPVTALPKRRSPTPSSMRAIGTSRSTITVCAVKLLPQEYSPPPVIVDSLRSWGAGHRRDSAVPPRG